MPRGTRGQDSDRTVRALPIIFAAVLTLATTTAPAIAAPVGVDVARPDAKTQRILGDDGDNAAYTVAQVGDVNGDGFKDLAIGAPYADYAKRKDSGSVYIVYGRRPYQGVDLHLLDIRGGGFRVDGVTAGDHFGTSVSGGGDLNGDGYADIVVGAPDATFYGRKGSGITYVIHGGPRNGALDLKIAPADDYDVIGGRSRGDHSGTAVAFSGDTNGDGIPDVLVGAPGADGQIRNYPLKDTNTGAAFVVRWNRGNHAGAPVDLAQSATGQVFALDGLQATERVGTSIADAGFVDADNLHDVVVGGPGADRNQRIDSGSAFVVSPRQQTGDRSLSDLANGFGYRIDGMSDGARLGTSVAGVGDVSGDGVADQVIGAPGAAFGRRFGAGKAVVAFGQTKLPVLDTRALGDRGYTVVGAAFDDAAGTAVAAAGDYNGDGLADLVVGAPEADGNCRGASGSAYVVYGKFGRAPVLLSDLQPERGFQIDGGHSGDRMGFSVADAFGFSGPGAGIIAGSSSVNRPRDNGGAAWVITPGVRKRTVRRYGTRLPIRFLKRPGGYARDYEGYLSIPVESRGGLIRNVFAGVYTFGGRRIGAVSIGRLAGRRTLNIKLTERLRAGGVSVTVSGQPNPNLYCGPKTRSIALRFR